MDTFVNNYPLTVTGCTISLRTVTQLINGSYVYNKMVGHNCTGYTLNFKYGWETVKFGSMIEMTSAHKGPCVNKTTDATYTYCDYYVQAGTAKQLGASFPYQSVATYFKSGSYV